MSVKPSPNFRKLLTSANNGEVIIPLLRTVLYNPKFKSFNVKMPKMGVRAPDDWFHPSTHPLWPERLLYYYLAYSKDLVSEPFDHTSTMAVMQGHYWHTIVEKVLVDIGYLLAGEVEVQDLPTGSRGHMDGLSRDEEVFEFKTMRQPKAAKIAKGKPDDPEVLASFRTLCPEYYAQGQEYMRLSGLRRWRALILSLEYPYDMREIVMDFNPVDAYAVRDKYLRVRQAVADQRPPIDCCKAFNLPSKKTCPARSLCLP